MSASITITLSVRISTQKNDKVAVTGADRVLGAWDPQKVKFMKPQKSEGDVWSTKINVPLTIEGLEYRYLVCRRFNSAYGDDADDETHIIRHWESGIYPRYKKILEFASGQSIDVYGAFEPSRKMFVDQGWLINETEIQLRFYKNPIHLFKKRDRAESYNVKCSAVNLFHYAFPCVDDSCATEEHFDQIIHASNPLIRVTSLGYYKNKEQSSNGMSVSSTDYVIYKLRTIEFDSHAIKVDFYKLAENGEPILLGYTNLLPLHLESGSGSVVLAINGSHGFPIGQVTVRYLVCKPCRNQPYDLSKSFSKWWKTERQTLEIGHRGLGDTHYSDLNSNEEKGRDIQHENTIGALITAGESGADFVEFDVMLSKDKVAIIWHDFLVSILLRKRTRGHHRVHHIPVNELTLSQLQDLRVEFAKANKDCEHRDLPDSVDDAIYHRDVMSPFPTLKGAFEAVDDCVGFYIELKYPQYRYESKQKEEGIESYFERNVYLDAILQTLHDHAADRRIVLASFDADICVMARLKQNRYPVIMLIEDNGAANPYYHDVRTHKVPTAVSLARSEKLLGLSVNAAALMRDGGQLLDLIFSENLICFVWGPAANEADVREHLKKRHVHAICHDQIASRGTQSVYRAEHEERLRKVMGDYQSTTPAISPAPSLSGSPTNSANDITKLVEETKIEGALYAGQSSSIQADPRSGLPSKGSIPIVRVTPVPKPAFASGASSMSSLDKIASGNKSSGRHSQSDDYTIDFY